MSKKSVGGFAAGGFISFSDLGPTNNAFNKANTGTGSGNSNNYFTGKATIAPVYNGGDADLGVLCKKLLKKDVTTRLKALVDIQTILRKRGDEVIPGFAPFFVHAYIRLAVMDTTPKVREGMNSILYAMVGGEKLENRKAVRQFTAELLPMWWLSASDSVSEVASVASASFRAAVPEARRRAVLAQNTPGVCSLLNDLLLKHSAESLTEEYSNSGGGGSGSGGGGGGIGGAGGAAGDGDKNEVLERYERVVVASIHALREAVNALADSGSSENVSGTSSRGAAAGADSVPAMDEASDALRSVLCADHFWKRLHYIQQGGAASKSGGSSVPMRCAMYRLLSVVCSKMPELLLLDASSPSPTLIKLCTAICSKKLLLGEPVEGSSGAFSLAVQAWIAFVRAFGEHYWAHQVYHGGGAKGGGGGNSASKEEAMKTTVAAFFHCLVTGVRSRPETFLQWLLPLITTLPISFTCISNAAHSASLVEFIVRMREISENRCTSGDDSSAGLVAFPTQLLPQVDQFIMETCTVLLLRKDSSAPSASTAATGTGTVGDALDPVRSLIDQLLLSIGLSIQSIAESSPIDGTGRDTSPAASLRSGIVRILATLHRATLASKTNAGADAALSFDQWDELLWKQFVTSCCLPLYQRSISCDNVRLGPSVTNPPLPPREVRHEEGANMDDIGHSLPLAVSSDRGSCPEELDYDKLQQHSKLDVLVQGIMSDSFAATTKSTDGSAALPTSTASTVRGNESEVYRGILLHLASMALQECISALKVLASQKAPSPALHRSHACEWFMLAITFICSSGDGIGQDCKTSLDDVALRDMLNRCIVKSASMPSIIDILLLYLEDCFRLPPKGANSGATEGAKEQLLARVVLCFRACGQFTGTLPALVADISLAACLSNHLVVGIVALMSSGLLNFVSNEPPSTNNKAATEGFYQLILRAAGVDGGNDLLSAYDNSTLIEFATAAIIFFLVDVSEASATCSPLLKAIQSEINTKVLAKLLQKDSGKSATPAARSRIDWVILSIFAHALRMVPRDSTRSLSIEPILTKLLLTDSLRQQLADSSTRELAMALFEEWSLQSVLTRAFYHHHSGVSRNSKFRKTQDEGKLSSKKVAIKKAPLLPILSPIVSVFNARHLKQGFDAPMGVCYSWNDAENETIVPLHKLSIGGGVAGVSLSESTPSSVALTFINSVAKSMGESVMRLNIEGNDSNSRQQQQLQPKRWAKLLYILCHLAHKVASCSSAGVGEVETIVYNVLDFSGISCSKSELWLRFARGLLHSGTGSDAGSVDNKDDGVNSPLPVSNFNFMCDAMHYIVRLAEDEVLKKCDFSDDDPCAMVLRVLWHGVDSSSSSRGGTIAASLTLLLSVLTTFPAVKSNCNDLTTAVQMFDIVRSGVSVAGAESVGPLNSCWLPSPSNSVNCVVAFIDVLQHWLDSMDGEGERGDIGSDLLTRINVALFLLSRTLSAREPYAPVDVGVGDSLLAINNSITGLCSSIPCGGAVSAVNQLLEENISAEAKHYLELACQITDAFAMVHCYSPPTTDVEQPTSSSLRPWVAAMMQALLPAGTIAARMTKGEAERASVQSINASCFSIVNPTGPSEGGVSFFRGMHLWYIQKKSTPLQAVEPVNGNGGQSENFDDTDSANLVSMTLVPCRLAEIHAQNPLCPYYTVRIYNNNSSITPSKSTSPVPMHRSTSRGSMNNSPGPQALQPLSMDRLEDYKEIQTEGCRLLLANPARAPSMARSASKNRLSSLTGSGAVAAKGIANSSSELSPFIGKGCVEYGDSRENSEGVLSFTAFSTVGGAGNDPWSTINALERKFKSSHPAFAALLGNVCKILTSVSKSANNSTCFTADKLACMANWCTNITMLVQGLLAATDASNDDDDNDGVLVLVPALRGLLLFLLKSFQRRPIAASAATSSSANTGDAISVKNYYHLNFTQVIMGMVLMQALCSCDGVLVGGRTSLWLAEAIQCVKDAIRARKATSRLLLQFENSKEDSTYHAILMAELSTCVMLMELPVCTHDLNLHGLLEGEVLPDVAASWGQPLTSTEQLMVLRAYRCLWRFRAGTGGGNVGTVGSNWAPASLGTAVDMVTSLPGEENSANISTQTMDLLRQLHCCSSIFQAIFAPIITAHTKVIPSMSASTSATAQIGHVSALRRMGFKKSVQLLLKSAEYNGPRIMEHHTVDSAAGIPAKGIGALQSYEEKCIRVLLRSQDASISPKVALMSAKVLDLLYNDDKYVLLSLLYGRNSSCSAIESTMDVVKKALHGPVCSKNSALVAAAGNGGDVDDNDDDMIPAADDENASNELLLRNGMVFEAVFGRDVISALHEGVNLPCDRSNAVSSAASTQPPAENGDSGEPLPSSVLLWMLCMQRLSTFNHIIAQYHLKSATTAKDDDEDEEASAAGGAEEKAAATAAEGATAVEGDKSGSSLTDSEDICDLLTPEDVHRLISIRRCCLSYLHRSTMFARMLAMHLLCKPGVAALNSGATASSTGSIGLNRSISSASVTSISGREDVKALQRLQVQRSNALLQCISDTCSPNGRCMTGATVGGNNSSSTNAVELMWYKASIVSDRAADENAEDEGELDGDYASVDGRSSVRKKSAADLSMQWLRDMSLLPEEYATHISGNTEQGYILSTDELRVVSLHRTICTCPALFRQWWDDDSYASAITTPSAFDKSGEQNDTAAVAVRTFSSNMVSSQLRRMKSVVGRLVEVHVSGALFARELAFIAQLQEHQEKEAAIRLAKRKAAALVRQQQQQQLLRAQLMAQSGVEDPEGAAGSGSSSPSPPPGVSTVLTPAALAAIELEEKQQEESMTIIGRRSNAASGASGGGSGGSSSGGGGGVGGNSSSSAGGAESSSGSSVGGAEIIACYRRDDTKIELRVKLSSMYPLRNAEVELTSKLGIAEKKWKRWKLQIIQLLTNNSYNQSSSVASSSDGGSGGGGAAEGSSAADGANANAAAGAIVGAGIGGGSSTGGGSGGSILEAIQLWKDNVDKEFDGIEPCPICYTTVHLSSRHLPTLECKTCHNKFHSVCLNQWFKSSGKSKCVICQQPFYD